MRRIHVHLAALPAVLLLAVLAGPQPAGAWCNTPRPALPERPKTPGTIPGTPGTGVPTGGRRGVPTPGRGSGTGTPFLGYASAWRIWWDFNREHLLGIRGITRIQAGETESDSAVDPMVHERARVREVLHRIALSGDDEDVRAAALCALGRAGSPGDAEVFLRVLGAPGQPRQVIQGAAIGLAGLPRLLKEEHLEAVRTVFDALLADRVKLPERSRLICIMALAFRGRSDPALVRALAARIERPGIDPNESSALLFAYGLPRLDLSSPLLCRVAESGELGNDSLHDVARSHAVLGLALAGGPEAAPTIAKVLDGKDSQVHARRSAALAAGHLLREGGIAEPHRSVLIRALAAHLESDADPIVRGYSAIACGYAREESSPDLLMRVVTSGPHVVRPFAALALGLAARDLSEPVAARVKDFLLKQYREASGSELPGALSLSLALAGAQEARELIARHVASPRTDVSLRGPACQALGLLAVGDEDAERALKIALADSSDEVAQNAALGLGLHGGPESAKLLVRLLSGARSELMQAHMVTGLSHLGGKDAVDPLLRILTDPTRKTAMRVSAATALGLIVAPRGNDPLFELDAYTNPWSLTDASRELVQVF